MIFAVDLLKPFTYEFFRNGLLIATLAGALCGLIGVFVVLRGMSYIGHGLSHAVFGGAALAAVLNLSYFLGAGLWGLASGLMIGRVARKRIIGADAAIGVITTASFAMGLALQARFGQAKQSIDAVLRYVDVLRDDDLIGGPGDSDHSWMGLMRFNYVTMVEALGGDASALKALDVSDVGLDTADYAQ